MKALIKKQQDFISNMKKEVTAALTAAEAKLATSEKALNKFLDDNVDADMKAISSNDKRLTDTETKLAADSKDRKDRRKKDAEAEEKAG